MSNRFKRFKNGDFDISDKEHSERPAAVEEDELRRYGKKSCKTMKNSRLIFIVDKFYRFFFYCNKGNCKKSANEFSRIFASKWLKCIFFTFYFDMYWFDSN